MNPPPLFVRSMSHGIRKISLKIFVNHAKKRWDRRKWIYSVNELPSLPVPRPLAHPSTCFWKIFSESVARGLRGLETRKAECAETQGSNPLVARSCVNAQLPKTSFLSPPFFVPSKNFFSKLRFHRSLQLGTVATVSFPERRTKERKEEEIKKKEKNFFTVGKEWKTHEEIINHPRFFEWSILRQTSLFPAPRHCSGWKPCDFVHFKLILSR